MSGHDCPECGESFPSSSCALDGSIGHDCHPRQRNAVTVTEAAHSTDTGGDMKSDPLDQIGQPLWDPRLQHPPFGDPLSDLVLALLTLDTADRQNPYKVAALLLDQFDVARKEPK